MSGEHTPGTWTAYRMMSAHTGVPMTPDEIGVYVRNSVLKSFEESGTMDFLFIGCDKPNGRFDVCHVGNGPDGPANARLIAAAPQILKALKDCYRLIGDMMPGVAKISLPNYALLNDAPLAARTAIAAATVV